MKHELPPLPYAKDALAQVLSEETLNYHYGKHERAYIDNVNKLIEGTPFADMTFHIAVISVLIAHTVMLTTAMAQSRSTNCNAGERCVKASCSIISTTSGGNVHRSRAISWLSAIS